MNKNEIYYESREGFYDRVIRRILRDTGVFDACRYANTRSTTDSKEPQTETGV